MTDCVQLSTTLPDKATATRLGAQLVEERLAACAQVVGPVSSSYWWQGQVEQAQEWYCHLKTTYGASPKLSRRLRELHPYEVPEIIVVEIKEGDPSYLQWIRETVQSSPTLPVP
ncbi:MAG TPA: divalent-cation tolerance protein CutA [Gemmatimonadales bacterium]|nr:divalent-cation tolerance protein CutA [Gemmatimonadales bacterium]